MAFCANPCLRRDANWVGGIFSAADARAHFQAGADLVQIYTGLIYRGPNLVDDILRDFSTNGI